MKQTVRLRRHRRGATVAGRPNLPKQDYESLIRSIWYKAEGRCEDPWCRVTGWLEPHHVVKRSQGGSDSRDNIVVLCRTSHRQTDLPKKHKDWLGVEAQGNETFVFTRLSDQVSPNCDIASPKITTHIRYIRP